MLLNKGRHRGERILSRPAVELMMTDQLTPAQKQGTELFFGDSASWGLGGAVITRRTDLLGDAGALWLGRRLRQLRPSRSGRGHGRHPDDDAHDGNAQPPRVFTDFWTSAYQAIDD